MAMEKAVEKNTSEPNGLELVLEIWGRRKWLAIVIFLAAASAVVTTVTFLPEVYQSSATVLIERQQIPAEFVRSTVTSALEVRLHTISQEILSRSRLEGLIERFDLYRELRGDVPVEAIIQRMRSDIHLDLRGGNQRGDRTTVAFAISYAGRDPQQVAAVTNTLASFYIEQNLKVRAQQAMGTSEFLSSQLEEMKRNLEQQEARVSQFKDQYAGQLPHQQEGNLSALHQLNTRLSMNADSQMRVSERLAQLEDQLAEMEAAREGPNATAIRIAELRSQLRELRKKYSDRYPDVIRLKSEIADLVEQLRQADMVDVGESATTGHDPRVQQLERSIHDARIELRSLKAEAERLSGSIAGLQSRVENAPRREQEYHVLMRDYETSRELYRSLLHRQQEAELAESMEQRQKGEQFRIIEAAFPSERPAAPDRTRLLLMGFLLSLGLAAGAVVLAEQLDTSFHRADSLQESLSVPVLVGVPHIFTRTDRLRRNLRFGLATVWVVVGLAAIVATSYYFAAGNETIVAMLLR